jgi:hypothetical protein
MTDNLHFHKTRDIYIGLHCKKLTILSIWFQYFHNIRHKIWQLLIELYLFLIFSNPISLSPRFVGDSLHVGFHDTDIIVQEMNALPQFTNTHVSCFVIIQFRFFFLSGRCTRIRGLDFFFFLFGFTGIVVVIAAVVTPNIVSL